MYDALAKILGLEALAAAESLLGQTRKEPETTVKTKDAALPELQKLLDGREEPSAERVRRELASRTPNLAVLNTIVSAGAPGRAVPTTSDRSW